MVITQHGRGAFLMVVSILHLGLHIMMLGAELFVPFSWVHNLLKKGDL
jgi:hypothetical protein